MFNLPKLNTDKFWNIFKNGLIILLVILLMFSKCANRIAISELEKQHQSNLIAISDSFKLIKQTDSIVIYKDRTVYLTAKGKDKDKIAEVNIPIQSSVTKTDTIEKLIYNDSGEVIEINDSLSNLTYKLSLEPTLIDNNRYYKRTFNYNYRVDLNLQIKEDKKGYYTQIIANDPNLRINGGNSIFYNKTNKEIRRQKLKKFGIYTGLVGSFFTGIVIGNKL